MTLLRPEWLLALPLIVALGIVALRGAQGPGAWSRAIDPHLMAAMQRLGRVERRGASGALLAALLAAAIIAVALSGPAVERRDASAYRNLEGAIAVLDASPSMVEGPEWANVVTALRGAVGGLGSKPAALIVFAGDAYVAMPLTSDSRQVGLTLSLVEAGTVPDPGSRPERALALARDMLADAEILRGDIVLASDGGGLGPEALSVARQIADDGARLLVLVADGTEPAATAIAETLAAAGEGRVFRPQQGADLAATLAPDAGDRVVRQDLQLLFQVDYGRYLLVFALLPIALLLRRRAT